MILQILRLKFYREIMVIPADSMKPIYIPKVLIVDSHALSSIKAGFKSMQS